MPTEITPTDLHLFEAKHIKTLSVFTQSEGRGYLWNNNSTTNSLRWFNTGARSGAGLYLFVLVRSMWPLSAGARLSPGANEADIWSPASALRCRDRSHWGPCSVLYSNVIDTTDTWIYTGTFEHTESCWTSERLVFRHLLNIRNVLEPNCSPRLVQVEYLDTICGKTAVKKMKTRKCQN